MILACDVGGTKTDLALFEPNGPALELVKRNTYRSKEHPTFTEIVTDFLGPNPPGLLGAGFGVAGPVLRGRAKTTNLPWVIEAPALAEMLLLTQVSLINDLEAQMWATQSLTPSEYRTLQPGNPDQGNHAILAAGTGLGCAALIDSAHGNVLMGTEGGHADFAPFNEESAELGKALQAEFGTVSAEHVVSGPGIFRVYTFLRNLDPSAEPEWLAEQLAPGDPVPALVKAAQNGTSELATRAVLLFLAAYGAEAGNWALRTLATGGFWLGGGVARRVLFGPPDTPEEWQSAAASTFLGAFRAKGKMADLVANIPVHVITSDLAALSGAARYAQAHLN